MKFYYPIAVLAHLLTAFLDGNENRKAYLLYLWGDLFNGKKQPPGPKSQAAVGDYAVDTYLALILLTATASLGNMVS